MHQTYSAERTPPQQMKEEDILSSQIPDKFRDPETGEVRLDLLLKSYGELERKLAGMVAIPADGAPSEERARFHRALGVPEAPDQYDLTLGHEDLEADPDANRRMHEAGFTPRQAQLVYDLAKDYVVPMLGDMGSEHESMREMERLQSHFGGEARWREVAGQVKAWGKANLPTDAYDSLTSSADGCLAMHRMMQGGEPALGKAGKAETGQKSQADLDSMMRDPRYWKTRDPRFVAKVTEGFRRLYPGGA